MDPGHPFLIGEVWVVATTMNIRIFGTTKKPLHASIKIIKVSCGQVVRI